MLWGSVQNGEQAHLDGGEMALPYDYLWQYDHEGGFVLEVKYVSALDFDEYGYPHLVQPSPTRCDSVNLVQ